MDSFLARGYFQCFRKRKDEHIYHIIFNKSNFTYLEVLPISLTVFNSSEYEPGKVSRPIQVTPKAHEHFLVGGKYSQSLSFPKARKHKNTYKSPKCSAWSWPECTIWRLSLRGVQEAAVLGCAHWWVLPFPRQGRPCHPAVLLLTWQILNLDSGAPPSPALSPSPCPFLSDGLGHLGGGAAGRPRVSPQVAMKWDITVKPL